MEVAEAVIQAMEGATVTSIVILPNIAALITSALIIVKVAWAEDIFYC